jgi:hypothetical protein
MVEAFGVADVRANKTGRDVGRGDGCPRHRPTLRIEHAAGDRTCCLLSERWNGGKHYRRGGKQPQKRFHQVLRGVARRPMNTASFPCVHSLYRQRTKRSAVIKMALVSYRCTNLHHGRMTLRVRYARLTASAHV